MSDLPLRNKNYRTEAVQDRLARMGTIAAQMVTDAMNLVARQGDASVAEQTIVGCGSDLHLLCDAFVRDLQGWLEQEPAGEQRRLLIAARDVVVELLRIGDYATGIARVAQRIGEDGLGPAAFLAIYGRRFGEAPAIDLRRFRSVTRAMVDDAVAAFVTGDVTAADLVMEHEEEADRLKAQTRSALTAGLHDGSGPAMPPQLAFRFAFVIHYLERIGNHAVNIAERTLNVKTGQLPTVVLR